jgi:radical SAM superfamily enzyme YgiQ (UPF0313 family)
MKISVTFVELSTYENILPIVSGTLQVYAQQDSVIAEQMAFSICTKPVTADENEFVEDLISRGSDIYAMSWYIWNASMMRRILDRLLAARPDSRFILGGPQVMNHAADYIPDGRENVVVCNGEGERTFQVYLQSVVTGADLTTVPGISFYRTAFLHTTPEPDRIRDLTEIPSPFLAGVFNDGQYTIAILETNRGCPFRCAFCYWGAATNDRVYKHDLERIKADVTWLSEHNYVNIFVADANWGMVPRDLEVTDHIVDCRQRNGYPLMIVVQSAKNKPERMAEITEKFVRGGLITSQPVSLQTLDPTALELIDRKNIKEETYTVLQHSLREKRISSFVELIWPLPGETLDTFKAGIDRLCRMGADTLVVYPQLLLHNTPLHERVEEYGLVVERAPSSHAEADVVVGTNWVSESDCLEGTWFYYSLHTLYNARMAYYLATYLDQLGVMRYSELFSAFTTHLKAQSDSPFADFVAASVAARSNYDLLNNGAVIHRALHDLREHVTELLHDFARSQSWWSDPGARTAFELDRLATPYVYRERVRPIGIDLEMIDLIDTGRDSYTATVPADCLQHVRADVEGIVPPNGHVTLTFDHRGRHKLPYMSRRSADHNAVYCQAMIERLRDILPVVQASSAVAQLV